jgi:hypothetical protein
MHHGLVHNCTSIILVFMHAMLILTFALLLPGSADAARFSLMGVANSSEPNEPGTEYSSVSGYGAGLLMEFRLMPAIGIEFGALFMPRKFAYNTVVPTNTKTTVSAKVYEFPVLLRMHLGRLFSLGVGGYFARAAGEMNTETKTDGGAASTQTVSYASRSQTDTDFGALASLALYIRLAALTHLAVDARYTMGMKNNSTAAGGDRKFNDMQLLAGLQFGF